MSSLQQLRHIIRYNQATVQPSTYSLAGIRPGMAVSSAGCRSFIVKRLQCNTQREEGGIYDEVEEDEEEEEAGGLDYGPWNNGECVMKWKTMRRSKEPGLWGRREGGICDEMEEYEEEGVWAMGQGRRENMR